MNDTAQIPRDEFVAIVGRIVDDFKEDADPPILDELRQIARTETSFSPVWRHPDVPTCRCILGHYNVAHGRDAGWFLDNPLPALGLAFCDAMLGISSKAGIRTIIEVVG